MIKIEHTDVVGWEAAIRGMRNPMNSWDKSDTEYFDEGGVFRVPRIGPNDLDLMRRLRDAGTDHRKYMRMIAVYLDITAPLYWWTVANSCSTMHKIHAKEFARDDFSHERLEPWALEILDNVIWGINAAREQYEECKAKSDWWQMIQLLPTSYNQKRTVMLNYEVLANMHHGRKSHKLDEWHEFCRWIESLPYSELITGDMA